MFEQTQVSQISSPEELLDQKADFSLSVLNLFADACNHTRFEFQEPEDQQKRVKLEKREGQDITTIYLPPNPTLNDILQAASLIDQKEGKKEETLLFQIAKRFKDLAIYLSHHPLFQGKDELITYFFSLGSILEIKAENVEVSSFTPLTIDQIKSLPLQPPRDISENEYKDHLFLFLLGKNLVFDQIPEGDKKLLDDPAHSFYATLYHRWRASKGKLDQKDAFKTEADTEELRREFDRRLLTHKDFILSFLSLQNPRAQTAISQLTHQVVQQLLEERLFKEGIRFAKERLKPPTVLLPPEMVEFLREIIPNFDLLLTYSTLFEMSQGLLQKNKDLPTKERVKLLRDLVFSYPPFYTYKISTAIETQKFECNLRSLFLAALYEQFLGDEVVVFADKSYDHVRLIVGERASLETESPQFYFVDPSIYEDYGKRINRIFEITPITDRNFIQPILEAYRKNPSLIRLNLKLETDLPFEQYHRIGNWQALTEAGLWLNIGHNFAKNPEEQRRCYRKALELDPNDPIAWNNLGAVSETIEEQRRCYRKALELDPNNPVAWINLGAVSETIEEQRRCYRKALELDPNNPKAKFNLVSTYFNENLLALNPETLEELEKLANQVLESQEKAKKEWFTPKREKKINDFLKKIKLAKIKGDIKKIINKILNFKNKKP